MTPLASLASPTVHQFLFLQTHSSRLKTPTATRDGREEESTRKRLNPTLRSFDGLTFLSSTWHSWGGAWREASVQQGWGKFPSDRNEGGKRLLWQVHRAKLTAIKKKKKKVEKESCIWFCLKHFQESNLDSRCYKIVYAHLTSAFYDNKVVHILFISETSEFSCLMLKSTINELWDLGKGWVCILHTNYIICLLWDWNYE